MPKVGAFIQARMSSSRFPGKVLAPFLGKPIVAHVVEAVLRSSSVDQVVVLTSEEPSDDPLEAYVTQFLQVPVFRGPLDDVLLRFQLAVGKYPVDWVLRLCADSPLLLPEVVSAAVGKIDDGIDVVTTRFAPKFPKGQNADLIRADILCGVDPDESTDHDREHVGPFFYRHRERYTIADAEPPSFPDNVEEFTVDTPQDLQRLTASFSG